MNVERIPTIDASRSQRSEIKIIKQSVRDWRPVEANLPCLNTVV